MDHLASIISFCTNDLRFLDRCIHSIRNFSSQIIIPVCDHFYNGQIENLPLLEQIYQKYPDIDFIQFDYSTKEVYGTPAKLQEGSPGWSQHWHNTSRLIGAYFLKPEIEWVLFLDVDEIFSEEIPATHLDALRFATFFYFDSAKKCATVYPDGPLLIRREKLKHEFLIDEHERMGLFYKIEGKKERQFLVDGRPIVHHYSWVRPEQEMLKKAATWGHHWERDWKTLIQEKKGEDFVRHYSYKAVPLFWDPLSEKVELPEANGPFSHVKRVTHKEIFHREIREILNDRDDN